MFGRHFASKAAVLEAAVDDAAAGAAFGVEVYATLDDLPLDHRVLFIARGTWMFFDSQRDLMLVLTRESGPLPNNHGHDSDNFPGNGVAFLAHWLNSATGGAPSSASPTPKPRRWYFSTP